MLFHMFMVFGTSAGIILIIVRGLQLVLRFGWNTPQTRSVWGATLVIPLLLIFNYLSAVRITPERWGAAVGLGVIVAALLLVTAKPQWSKEFKS